MLAKYLNPILLPLATNELTLTFKIDFAEEVVNYNQTLTLPPMMLSHYLPTSIWKKLLRTVSTIYSPIIFIVVN